MADVIDPVHGGVRRRMPVFHEGPTDCRAYLYRTYAPARTLWCPSHGHVVDATVPPPDWTSELWSDALAESIRHGRRLNGAK